MRWIIRAVLILAAFGILGMTALFAVPTDEITALAERRLSEATGRELVIRGAVRPRLVPVLGIRAEEIEIGNPDWVTEGPMVVAQSLDIGVAWGQLLRGRLHLRSAELVGPRLVLVRGADGRVSWDLSGDGPVEPTAPTTTNTAAQTESAAPRIGFDRIDVTDAAVLFVDQQAGRTLEYDPVSVALVAAGEGGEMQVTLGRPSGDIAVTLALSSITALETGSLSDIALTLDWPGGSAGFDGRGGFSPALEGALRFEASDLGPLFAAAGMPAPELPEGLGQENLSATADVTLADGGSIHLRNASARLDGNQLEMELDLLPGADRPLLRGNVTAGSFSLSPDEADTASGQASDEGGGATAPTGWSNAPIDASALFAIDTDIALTAGRLALGDIALEELSARIAIDAGRMEADLAYATIFQGAIAGRVVANARGTFSARAELEIADIALNPTIVALTGYDRLDGNGSGQISVVAQGDSQAALMRDLEGSGSIEFGQGAIIGLDIGGMIRNFDAGFRGEGARTVYDSISASFTLSGGVVDNQDLLMAAPWGGVRGAGEVDIGGRTLDYLVTPGLSARDDGTTRVNIPIRIRGSWDDPSFAPDLEALAEQELSEEIDALEDAATDAARDLVRDQLGVTIDEDASREEAVDQIEEAIGDRLEEELGDRLRGLLE